MANRDDKNSRTTGKDSEIINTDDLLDSNELLDSDLLNEPDEMIVSDDLIDLDDALDDLDLPDPLDTKTTTKDTDKSEMLLDDSWADELEELTDSMQDPEPVSSEIDIPEHAATEQAQHAAELAAKEAEQAEAIALMEIQVAKDAKEAAEQAIAAAEAAEKSAEKAQLTAQASVAAEEKAAEKAQKAAEAEAKAIEEARLKAEEEARLKAEEEARLKAEEEARLKAEEEARLKAEEEARLKAEEEARLKAEEEARLKAEEEARLKAETAKINAAIEADEFLSLNLDEDEEPVMLDDGLETLSSLDEELNELTEWVEPEIKEKQTEPAMDHNETTQLESSENETNTEKQAQVAETHKPKSKEEPMTDHKKAVSGIASNIMLSFTLISLIIAALAIWMSLDASQQTANLATEPAKLQKQIDQMNEHQQKQTQLLQQQIENLQQQLKILTNVISNKTSEQWRSAIEQPVTSVKKTTGMVAPQTRSITTEAAIKSAAAQPKPIKNKVITKTIAQSKKIDFVKKPSIDTSSANNPFIQSEHTTDAASVQGWVVYLFSTASQKSAERETRKFINKGIKAKYLRTVSKGKVWYHVLVSGFKTERKAAAFKKFLKEYHNADAYYNKSDYELSKGHRATDKSIQQIKPSPSLKKVNSKAVAKKTATDKKTAITTHRFRFNAVDSEVWLQISAPNKSGVAKGKLLKEVLLKAGHHITIKAASESLWITAGNAPALSISVDGKVIANKGTLGTGKKVLRNYKFSIAK